MNIGTILPAGFLVWETSHRRTTVGVVCGLFWLSCAIPSPAFAASHPGSCASTSGDAAGACQFEVQSYTEALSPALSMGIRLDAGIRDVLFNNFSTVGPRFVSNLSGNDFFVPQKTGKEYLSFITSPPSGVTIDYAVVPRIYTATPSPAYATCGTPSPSSIDVSVPTAANSTSPVIVHSYSLVLNPLNPSTTQTTVGTTTQGQSPAHFNYTRQDCSTDDEGNNVCTTANFLEDQQLVFSATGGLPSFSWGAPVVTSSISSDCSKPYAPPINGVCGAANGDYSSTAPSTGLCSSGNASAVTTGSSGTWTWMCSGVNGGSNQSCMAMVPPPCSAKADKTASISSICQPVGVSVKPLTCTSAHAQPVDLSILLDASGSMQPVIAAAETAFKGLLSKLSSHGSNVNYSVVMIGGSGGYTPSGSGGDVCPYGYLAPFGHPNVTSILDNLGLVVADTNTPIAAAMNFAARDLTNTGHQRAMILISDGVDTCLDATGNPNITPTIRTMQNNGIKMYGVQILNPPTSDTGKINFDTLNLYSSVDNTGGEINATALSNALDSMIQNATQTCQLSATIYNPTDGTTVGTLSAGSSLTLLPGIYNVTFSLCDQTSSKTLTITAATQLDPGMVCK